MFRTSGAALIALVLNAGFLLAEEIKGTVKKTDTAANTITVAVDSKDRTFSVSKDVKVFTLFEPKKGGGRPVEVGIAAGLAGVKTGAGVTLTTEKKDGKELVSAIKLDPQTGKKK